MFRTSRAAFLAALEAPRELVHEQAFNVGANSENYRIREVAEIVAAVMPGIRVAFADGSSACRSPFTKSWRRRRRRSRSVSTGW